MIFPFVLYWHNNWLLLLFSKSRLIIKDYLHDSHWSVLLFNLWSLMYPSDKYLTYGCTNRLLNAKWRWELPGKSWHAAKSQRLLPCSKCEIPCCSYFEGKQSFTDDRIKTYLEAFAMEQEVCPKTTSDW